MRLTEEQYAELQRKRSVAKQAATAPAVVPPTKPPKYRNTRTESDGLHFDSKLEAEWYGHLRWLWSRGEVLWFVRQAPFDLPGKRKYRADFLVMYTAGCDFNGAKLARPVVQDCKGIDTPMSKLKRAQVEELYGIRVVLITRDDLKVRSL